MISRLVLILGATLMMTACADRKIAVTYTDPPNATHISNAKPVTIYRFADQRDVGGEDKDFKVGGVYGGYGNKLSTVLAEAPVMGTLQDALVAGFQASGVKATAGQGVRPERTDAFALTGDLKDFSVERRNTLADHVRAIVRLHTSDGRLLFASVYT